MNQRIITDSFLLKHEKKNNNAFTELLTIQASGGVNTNWIGIFSLITTRKLMWL